MPVRNEIVGTLADDVRLLDYPAELWIYDDSRLDEARQLLEGRISSGVPADPWRCGKCGEVVEGQFTDCWNCGEAQRAE